MNDDASAIEFQPCLSAGQTRLSVILDDREIARLEHWRRTNGPQMSLETAIRELASKGLAAHRREAAQRRQTEVTRAREDYEHAQIAEAKKTERLREVRRAKEEHERRAAAGEFPPLRAAPRKYTPTA